MAHDTEKNNKRNMSNQNTIDPKPRKKILRLYSQIVKGIRQKLRQVKAETPQVIFIKRHPTIKQAFTLQLRKECYKSSIEKLNGELMPIAGVDVHIYILPRGCKTTTHSK